MAQHSNYAKDRDLMMEAYGSVQGKIPHTQSTAPARLYNEAHCDEEHEGTEETVKVELELDKDNAAKLHAALMDEVAPSEDSSCASNEEEHAAEDAEGEHAGYSVGDMINGYDGEEIVTAVEEDGTIFTRELGGGGNKYSSEEINDSYSLGDMIDGHDGEEIVTDVTIFTRELGPGGNKYTPEEINNLPS